MYALAKKNKFDENRIILFDYDSNKITVMLAEGKGNSFRYFSNLKSGAVSINSVSKKLEIRC